MSNKQNELSKILNDFRQSSITIHANDSLGGGSKGADAFKKSLKETEKAILAWHKASTNKAVREALTGLRNKVGWEEEPDFDPGDATYGDTEHDHNAVVYGRNELKGSVQGMIETELANLKPQDTELYGVCPNCGSSSKLNENIEHKDNCPDRGFN